jgi:dipeptidyl aminopeptidase/acylaminoacyl peptidase
MGKLFFIFSLVVIMGTQSVFAEVSKERLCKTSNFISAKVSPDGKLIAKVGADELGIANVTVFSVENELASQKKLSFFKTPEIIQFFWSTDSNKVLLLKDENGTGQLNLHGFDIESNEHINYTENFPKVTTKFIKLSSKENKAIIGLNHRNPQFHDLYVLDLNSGEITLLLENDTFAKFLVSDELEVILKIKINTDSSWDILTSSDDLFMSLKAEEAFQTEFISYSSEEGVIYFLDNRFSNTNQLTQKSIADPYKEKLLGGQDFSDVDEVLFVGGKPKAYASYYTQKKWYALEIDTEQDINFLEEQIGGNFEVISQSKDNEVWIVSNSIPDKGNYFWMYKRASRLIDQISPSTLEKACEEKFSKMYEMVVDSRDGQKLVCYYTLPKEYDQGGYVDKPIPLVVVPHGGPFKVRDKFEFNLYHQWLASCGYGVLSVNFRLSSGFGKDFVNAGNGQWGGKAHLDVIDATQAFVDRGITSQNKVAIFGGSYGGYESLAALTFTPEYFTCCVAVCGPSNLKTILQSIPDFWEFTSKPLSDETMFFTKQAFITSMGGDPKDTKGGDYLEKCSPLNHLDKVKVPLLLVHGKNDHIVSENESKQIYESMKRNNKEVIYILFPNEGHRFANFSNKMMYLNQAELFLSQHLHGRSFPSEKELIADSTAEIFK